MRQDFSVSRADDACDHVSLDFQQENKCEMQILTKDTRPIAADKASRIVKSGNGIRKIPSKTLRPTVRLTFYVLRAFFKVWIFKPRMSCIRNDYGGFKLHFRK